MSFFVSKYVILWVSKCHFGGLMSQFVARKMSFCGTKRVILWPLACKIFEKNRSHFVGLLNLSFGGSRDAILRAESCHSGL